MFDVLARRAGRWPGAGRILGLWVCLHGVLGAPGLNAQPAAGHVQAEALPAAGRVELVRGVVIGQQPGHPPRALGAGAVLHEGDQVEVAPASGAVLRLADGTRLTLRPDTRLVLRTWRYPAPKGGAAMTLDLLRGGLRAVTGLITEDAPEAARIHTPEGVIAIRGTDLSARLCQGPGSCQQTARKPGGSTAPLPAAAARVLQSQGETQAADALARARRLGVGSSLYPGDRIITAAGAMLVLAFSDSSRLTLGPNSAIRIDDYRFDPAAPAQGRLGLALLQGGIRALTGLIARTDPRQVSITTPTATVAVRGTGFDLVCVGACAQGQDGPAADDLLRVCTWRGAIEVQPSSARGAEPAPESGPDSGPGSGPSQPVLEDQCAQLMQGQVQPSTDRLALDGPRPDTVPFPPELFSRQRLPEDPKGLIVRVAHGSARVITQAGSRDLGHDEAAHAVDGGVERVYVDASVLRLARAPLPSRWSGSGLVPMCR
jgi:hypothetical protein